MNGLVNEDDSVCCTKGDVSMVFGWIVVVSICVLLVSLGRLKCRMPSLSLTAYDI